MQYFNFLYINSLFNRLKYNVITLTYLYIDTLQSLIKDYIKIYNCYKIYKQTARDFYLLASKPDYIYHYLTNARNYSSLLDPKLFNKIKDLI